MFNPSAPALPFSADAIGDPTAQLFIIFQSPQGMRSEMILLALIDSGSMYLADAENLHLAPGLIHPRERPFPCEISHFHE